MTEQTVPTEGDWDLALTMNAQFDAGRASVAAYVLDHVQGLPWHPWIPGAVFKHTDLLVRLRRLVGVPQ